MIGFLQGLYITLKTALRKPVTLQYPDPDKRHQVAQRYMGFPALLWDSDVPEPYCTGCMVCIRACPTQCMSAQMTDNPKFAEDESRRRKIIETFEINLGRRILCGICVDVCNFDATAIVWNWICCWIWAGSTRTKQAGSQRILQRTAEYRSRKKTDLPRPVRVPLEGLNADSLQV